MRVGIGQRRDNVIIQWDVPDTPLRAMRIRVLVMLSFLSIVSGFPGLVSAAAYDYYENVKICGDIKTTIHYGRYDIQKVLRVPEIELLLTQKKQQVLTYRTDFHNGSENGCVRVFNNVKGGRLTPFFVLEELFWLSPDNYYQRVITAISSDCIRFDLYEVKGLNMNKVLAGEVRSDKDGSFRLKSVEEFREGASRIALHFADVYEPLINGILSNTY